MPLLSKALFVFGKRVTPGRGVRNLTPLTVATLKKRKKEVGNIAEMQSELPSAESTQIREDVHHEVENMDVDETTGGEPRPGTTRKARTTHFVYASVWETIPCAAY